MTTASFVHIDPASFEGKPWSKVDGPGNNFSSKSHQRDVHNIRGQEADFTTDNCGFTVYRYPAKEKLFTDDASVTDGYYGEVEAMLRDKIPGISKVVIFDHTIRRRIKDAPRQPVQQVHVCVCSSALRPPYLGTLLTGLCSDQSPSAAEARVRRHVSAEEADKLVQGRYQIINVWRPIENPATDMPLAVIDWRSTAPEDFIATDLMYPKRVDPSDLDDRGKEVLPDPSNYKSLDGYEVRGETMAVGPSERHKFYYQSNMTPEECILLKCFDSYGEGMPNGKKGLAVRTPHTAFIDPNTPAEAPGRQSIEVRCLVFYEQ